MNEGKGCIYGGLARGGPWRAPEMWPRLISRSVPSSPHQLRATELSPQLSSSLPSSDAAQLQPVGSSLPDLRCCYSRSLISSFRDESTYLTTYSCSCLPFSLESLTLALPSGTMDVKQLKLSSPNGKFTTPSTQQLV